MIRIVADTTAGLTGGMLATRGIALIPQIVIFGEQSYRDDTEMDTATFLTKLKEASTLPKTAAPPPVLYHPVFEQAQRAGEEVIVVAPSSQLSGTVRAAQVAAQDFPDLPVHVVDTQTIGGNLATLVLLAWQWAEEGQSAAAIVARLQEWIPRGRTYFLVNTLEYLHKGGRIGGAQALVGELLQVKPILCLRDGRVEPFEKQRTKKRALLRLAEIVREECPRHAEAHLCVMQADAREEALALAADLKDLLRLPAVPVYELPPAIVVHAGPGVMAVGFFVE